MKNFKILKVIFATLIFSIALSGIAFAGRQDFTLVNQTGRDIVNLYITPTNTYCWNDDILGVDVLENGESVHITFSRKETDRYWSMMAIFSDGNDWVWEKIDLFATSQITLRFDGAAISD